jgi:biotin-dependent carboxylase-like uncharacterized protein
MEPLPVLKVLKHGVYCALQDTGRFGYRHLGIPYSGAMDRHSYLYANQRLGNKLDAGELEIFGQGSVFMILADCIIFIAGAEHDITIDGLRINTSEPITVFEGQTLKIEKIYAGARIYISIKGGFYSSPVMNSISTLNGTHLVPLKNNDLVYKISGQTNDKKNLAGIRNIEINKICKIPALPGPEYYWLSQDSIDILESQRFIISPTSNRMGFRLFGAPLQKINQHEMLTSAVMPGTVQLTPDGQLIILMRDCQTTGGYPRVIQVEEWGISQLAQRLPGDDVVFQINV